MSPEILIVGERTHRGELVPRVQDLGYSVSPVRERELLLRVSESAGPVAVIVCLGGAETTEMVRSLRRSPAGTSVPVLLYGRLQGEIRELADVLELGADHFLEAPVADEELTAALVALVGPPQVARPKPGPEGEGRSGTGLSELHRTLDVLAARLETREESVDRDDLEAMGLDAVPDVDPEHDSGELEVLRETTQRLPEPRSRSRTVEPAPSKARRWGVGRELTKPGGEEISSTPVRRAADANSERTATIATEAREDVRKDRSTRGREARSDNRFEGTGAKAQVAGSATEVIAPPARTQEPAPAETASATGWRIERTWPKGQVMRRGEAGPPAPDGAPVDAAEAERGASRFGGRGVGPGDETARLSLRPAEGRGATLAGRPDQGAGRVDERGRSRTNDERESETDRPSARADEGAGRVDERGRTPARASGEREPIRGQQTERMSARAGEAHRPRWGEVADPVSSRTGRERAGEAEGGLSLRTGRGSGRVAVDGELSSRTGRERAGEAEDEVSLRTGRGSDRFTVDGEMSSRTGRGSDRFAVDGEMSSRTGRGSGRVAVDGELPSRTGSERGRPPIGAAPRLLAMGPARARGEAEGPELLARLRKERFTGCLQLLGRGQPERRVWWSEGQVIGGASASDAESVLGRLAARGLIGASQLELATRWNSGDVRRDLERLAQAGLIKPGEMQEALREPVRRIVERVAETGTIAWALHPDEVPPVQVELGVPLTALIAAGARRGMTRAQLLESVGDGRRPRLSFAGPEALAAELRWPELVAITGRFDGRTSVGELIAEAVADEEDVRAAVHVLGLLGHLAPEVDDPEATLAAVDRRRVRERLRMARESDYFALLGLPRAATRAEVLRAHADLTATFRDGLEPNSKVELAEEVAELLAALDEARDVLADDALHTAYLAQLEARR